MSSLPRSATEPKSARTDGTHAHAPEHEADDPEDFFSDFARQVANSASTNTVSRALEVTGDTVSGLPFIKDVKETFDSVNESTARFFMRKTDDLISVNAAQMINSIGVTMLNGMHDHAMPTGVHRLVDEAYGHMWPEVKKSLMDAVMLGAGLEFAHLRKQQLAHSRVEPKAKGLLKRAAARLIYAMEPYDLTFWGTIRSPLSLFIQLLFLFPFYGVSDLCVLTLATAKYFTDYNEYGLIQFIVSSKRLQFITTGLMSGALAFGKLFVCATLREDDLQSEDSYFRCETFAPGTHGTFVFEFGLFLIRSVLNWAVFFVLWNFGSLVAARRRTAHSLAAQQKLLAGSERRGLYNGCVTGALKLSTWSVTLYALLSALWASGLFDLIGDWLDVLALGAIVQLHLHNNLTKPKATPLQAKVGVGFSALVGLYLLWRAKLTAILPTPPDVGVGDAAIANFDVLGGLRVGGDAFAARAADPATAPAAFACLVAMVACATHGGLIWLQARAQADDAAALARLKMLMAHLDADGNGVVSKAELRRNFEQFWALLDADGDGQVTLAELAAAYGVSRLLRDEEAESASTPSSTAAAAAAAKGRSPADGDPASSEYIERRLEELHQREFGRVQRYPGGALVYFVVWDICAFVLSCSAVVPFLYNEMAAGEIGTLTEALGDWRIRVGLYFLKVTIALFAFPFLVFALPLMQDWLTHVKATGYDAAGNCMPKLSASQIKAKFRQTHLEAKKRLAMRSDEERRGGTAAASSSSPQRGCWDRFLGIDPELELSIEAAEAVGATQKPGEPMTVVEKARASRLRQARLEQLPEASLLVLEHAAERRLAGKLQLRGDPSALLML